MKDHIRDYSTEAFRFYARWGNKEIYIQNLLLDLQKNKAVGFGSPTESALIHKEMIMREYAAEIADLEAVEMVLRICGPNIKKALNYIYFEDPDKDLQWGDIKRRVHHAEIYIPASERQIYYWLKKARYMFAEERGLRIKKFAVTKANVLV